MSVSPINAAPAADLPRPWLAEYPPGVPAQADIHRYDSLVEVIDQCCQRYADLPAYRMLGSTLRFADIDRLPFSIKVLLEAVLRTADGYEVMPEDVERLARWVPQMAAPFEIPFKPGRVILQDFTGVPAVVDLAAMRAAMAELDAV